MRIAIIGAGFTGLTAAYQLSQSGYQVVIFEKESQVGGLAGGFKKKDWQWSLEKFFHHFFVSDQATKNLIHELGLDHRLFYLRPRTSIYKRGKISQFDSPLSVLKFPFLSFLERLRTGLITLFLKTYPEWKNLEKIKASSWLKKYYGQKAYQVLWQPLLKSKFGDQTEEISMAWFWARIKKRSSKLGYLEGGFQVLIKSLREKIEKNGGQVFLNHEVKNLNNLKDFDQIIVTTPAEAFLKIAAGLPKDYQNRLRKLEMLGALNLVLVSKEKFLTDGTYWLNINEPDFPFVAVVEHTNFIDPQSYANQQLVYVGGYYPQNHRYFKMKKEQIFKEWLPFLQKINPQFNPLSLISYCLFLDQFAQPIIPLYYSKIIPRFKTPIPHVYLANMQMVYPWDRGTNYAIELGKKVASEVSQDV